MPLHPLDESTLIDLIHGLVPPSERDEILAHLRQCPECEERMGVLVREREMLRAESQPNLSGAPAQASPTRRWRPSAPAMVAAAVIAVIAAGIPYFVRNRDSGSQYWIPLSENEKTFLRSSQDTAQAEAMGDVLRPYLEKDAENAVAQLTAYDVPPNDATAAALRELFLASALLNADRADEALASLERVNVRTLPAPWRTRGQWVQFLALTKVGREHEARELLERLQDAPGEIGEKARAEIKRTRKG